MLVFEWAHVSVYVPLEARKRELEPLALELQEVVSSPVQVLGSQPCSSPRAIHALNQ